MKRFLKVILILAAVFGVAGLGLTAGGAAMGATMGDVSVLDHGITQVLRVLDHEDSWEVEDSEEDMDEQEDDFQAAAERAFWQTVQTVPHIRKYMRPRLCQTFSVI